MFAKFRFLYEAIFIPDGVDAPPYEIINQTPMPEISGTTMNETSLTLESSSYKPDILVYTELIGKGRFLFGAFSP